MTGRRADGYHLLDSLVVFGGTADQVTVAPAEGLSLTVTGPRAAGVPADGTNIVLKAARALALAGGIARPGARIVLEKQIPNAAGLGGGSADAAAVLRLLDGLWGTGLDDARLAAIGLALGADVPVCLAGHPARMRGIGEVVDPVRLAIVPAPWLVLVNPDVAVPTGAVFAGLADRDNPPMPDPPAFADLDTLADYLAATRNDLEPPARAIAPVIGAVLDALRAAPGCRFARMSGSGATCFALFGREGEAQAATDALGRVWWAAAGRLDPQ